MISPQLAEETRALRQVWEAHAKEHTEAGLGLGLRDPRIHGQSILTRALIADSLWPGKFTDLIDGELRFGAVCSWLWDQVKAGRDRNAIIQALAEARPGACPQMVLETYQWLQTDACPVPDYISAALLNRNWNAPERLLFDPALDTFGVLWKSELHQAAPGRVRVLEPACESAHDYRVIHSHGLAAHIDYAGFDLVEGNIANAKEQFPEADFFVANIFESGLPDASFDYVFVHDLFEHLSPEGLECALSEVMRLTRREAWLHFFCAKDTERHHFQRAEHYYRNELSLPRLVETLRQDGAEVEVTSIASLLRGKFGYDRHPNPDAVTLMVMRP